MTMSYESFCDSSESTFSTPPKALLTKLDSTWQLIQSRMGRKYGSQQLLNSLEELDKQCL